MKICKHCKKETGTHFCSSVYRIVSPHDDNDSGDFITSAVIGAATNSALLGGLLGGDIVGGIVGDILGGGGLFD